MAVKIRMTRMGRRHRPFFRINAIDAKSPRDGKILEKLGHYDPIEKDEQKQIVLNIERIKYWLDNGAIPSDTVSNILLRAGIKHKYAEQKKIKMQKARALAAAKGKPFNKAQKIAIQKAAEAKTEAAKAKVEAEAEKAKADAEAKKTETETPKPETEKPKVQTPQPEIKKPEPETAEKEKEKAEPEAAKAKVKKTKPKAEKTEAKTVKPKAQEPEQPPQQNDAEQPKPESSEEQ